MNVAWAVGVKAIEDAAHRKVIAHGIDPATYHIRSCSIFKTWIPNANLREVPKRLSM